MSKERLDKIISVACEISRSDARKVIFSGRVSVAGAVTKDISQRIETENNAILFDGKTVHYSQFVYVMLNKPSGVVSASDDKRDATVVDIVKQRFNRNGLFPVGRLDKTSTGLLIVTDDGDFGHKVISPKSHIEKEYIVTLDGTLSEEDKLKIESGVTLADGTKCRECKIKILDLKKNIVSITITEGKYHEIKRMFGVVNLGVNALHRKRIGGLTLDENLESGEFRELTNAELKRIFYR